MNYYKNIAEILGVQLNEKFMLKDEDNVFLPRTYRITDIGLMFEFDGALETSSKLLDIISGRLTIVKKPWKPERGVPYWYYSEGWKEATINQWEDDLFDLLTWKVGNCFHTREEAETKGKDALKQLRKEFEES